MAPTKKGSILFTSSMALVLADDIQHSYVASKHAMVGMAKNLSTNKGFDYILKCQTRPLLIKKNSYIWGVAWGMKAIPMDQRFCVLTDERMRQNSRKGCSPKSAYHLVN
ncbi:hypothetical protein CFP56_043145 [Quercus suber]|uniref:Uncharacterized protein n=1 Tax=Quercus suber TaxID=58331 RepID=A0AAW0LHH4_QUESU